ncbi:DUF4367 domain-containing protein [Dorea sp. D27]|uniref:DUF4367 domain-containing protein n=1 Tax=Dorea sp. D27 TaxID=658665 RepID=UPI0006731995|nr:DUF4367 domain-containing protein [Dorea sp. D27]KMZ54544.1 hypothetical protein HMPREF0980_01398 [Dorea sp. D27]
MKEKLDKTEQLIQKEFHKEADIIEKDVEANCADEVVTDKITEGIRSNVNKNINDYEKERLYSLLPEEDRRALEIGRKIQIKKTRKKKKMYLSLAAALVLAMAIGVTSLGGPERIIKLMSSAVGDREISQVDSSEDNYLSIEEKEENAYQEIKDAFGCDIVRVVPCIEGMVFESSALDSQLQTAEIYYKIDNEKISYYINASFSEASWAIDVEDKVMNQWTKKIKGCDIKVKEYSTDGSKAERFSASFEYKGLEYFLNGTFEKEDLEKILNYLYFF